MLYLFLEPCLSLCRSLPLAGAAGGGPFGRALGERGKVALRRWRRGGLFRRGCRSWCICFSYEIFVPIFAPVRNNPPAVRGRTVRGRRCGRCGRGARWLGGGGDVLGEGLVCVFHGERVAGSVGVGGRGSCQGGGGCSGFWALRERPSTEWQAKLVQIVRLGIFQTRGHTAAERVIG